MSLKSCFELAGYDYIQPRRKTVSEIESVIINTSPKGMPTIVACIIDDCAPFSRLENIENMIILRTSIDRRLRLANEYVLPWVFEKAPIVLSPLIPASLPRIAFCGSITHPIRQAAIEAIKSSAAIESVFIIRKRFWGGAPHDPTVVQDFYGNMQTSEFNLCLRGGGNFSMRLYQTLSAGRIPVLIKDASTWLPFEEVLDWPEFCVVAETVEEIDQAILRFWREKDIVEAQRWCAKVSTEFFTEESYPMKFLECEIYNGQHMRWSDNAGG